ncbi:MAG: LicD family protein, partial [Bacteroidaceae bacterium]|nr:LicD family protein [Bacteroidaceae bacterium]
MRSITETSELRSVQMGVLDCIADVCRRHAINYSLSSGTLIGA